jgi:hypothetical protein
MLLGHKHSSERSSSPQMRGTDNQLIVKKKNLWEHKIGYDITFQQHCHHLLYVRFTQHDTTSWPLLNLHH